MNNDIVDRLRARADSHLDYGNWNSIEVGNMLHEAVGAILALRADNEGLRAEVASLTQQCDDYSDEIGNCRVLEWRALADQLAEALDDVLSSAPMMLGTIRDSWFYALAAHEAARRRRSDRHA